MENMNVKVDRKGKERKERGVTENGRKTKGPKGAKKMNKEDGKQRDVEHATEDQEAEVSRMGKDDHGNSNCERDRKQGEDEGNIWKRDRK